MCTFLAFVCDNCLLRTNLKIEVYFGRFKQLIYHYIVPIYVIIVVNSALQHEHR